MARVSFVGLGQEQLGISILSAVLRRDGHQTALAFNPALFEDRSFLDVPVLARAFDQTARVVDDLEAQAPDLVAFSVLTSTYQWCLEVAAAIKARTDVPVIFGGVHPSAVPDVCLENACVDFVCVGEGEVALSELCRLLPLHDARPEHPIPNLRWIDAGRMVVGPPAPFVQDLDSLPDPDKHLWRDHVGVRDEWMTMASRGCPYRCTFCFNNFFAKLPGKGGGKYLRRRSVDNVIAELVRAKAEFGIRRVNFQDDIFTTSKPWLEEFLRRYVEEVALPFQCLVHPRFIDEEMARWLRDAGCEHVQMGIQSADEDYKRHQLLRMESDSHVRAALAAMARVGLPVKADHILGLPGEPLSSQEVALELYRELTPRRIQTFWLTHIPGTELTRNAYEAGEITDDEMARIDRGTSGLFHSREAVRAEDAPLYRRYQLLFRALPLLPRPVRARIGVRHVPTLPAWLNEGVGLVFEAALVLIHRDRETINYLRQYGREVPRLLPTIPSNLRRNRSRWRKRPENPPAVASVIPLERASGQEAAMVRSAALRRSMT